MVTNARRNILLVEDEAIIALSEKKILEDHGFSVSTVYNGRDAVMSVKKNRNIDLILMDIDLGRGKMDGTAAAQKILSELEIPIVFLTSHSEKEMVDKVKGITRYGYVLKNAGEFVLVESIHMAFELFDTHQRLKQREAELEDLYENAPDAYFSVNMMGFIHRCNKRGAAMLGLSQEELAGRLIFDFYADTSSGKKKAKRLFERLKKGEAFRDEELQMRRADAGIIWISLSANPITDTDGTVIESRSIAVDITERKKAEEKAAFQAMLLDQIQDRITATDLAGRITYVNQAECELFRKSASEFIGKSVQAYGEDPDYGASQQEIINAVSTTGRWHGEVVNFTEDGRRILFDCRVQLVYDEAGTPSGMVGISTDVTERKKIEEDLYRKKESLRTTLNSIGDAVITADCNAVIDGMNPVAEQLTGWPLREARGKPLTDVFRIVNADTRSPSADPAERVLKEGRIVGLANHTILIAKDGKEYKIADSAAPVKDENGKITGVVLVFHDVTAEYQKNLQILESQRFLEGVVEAIQGGISVLDTDLRISYVNSWMKQKHGTGRSLVGRKCHEAYQKRGDICPWCPVVTALKTGTVQTAEIKIPLSDSRFYWSELTAYPLKNEHGEVVGVVEHIKDITERKNAEKSLRESEDRLRKVVETMPVMMDALDETSNFVMWNQECSRVTGFSAEEMVGNPKAMELLYPDDEYRKRMIDELTALGLDFRDKEFVLTCKDGTKKTISWSNVSGKVSIPGWHAWAIGVDITERKESEEKLKLALGERERLMRELNHRVKNNLNMVSSLLNLKDTTIGDAADLSDIKSQVDVISFIHDTLYQTADATHIKISRYLHDLLVSVFSFYRDAPVIIEENVKEVMLSAKTAVILGLILNEIATNAVKHGFVPGIEPRFTVLLTRSDKSDEYILSVSNNGRPFPEDISLDNPSTLGLQLITSMIQQLRGSIYLKRKPRTTYTMYIPIKKNRGE
ncbi:MAG: PAS domain S-box protein [Spirochaetia bacterium]